MKRFTSLLLVFACLLICIGCVAGCSKSNSGGSSSGSKITESRAIEIAKQRTVNAAATTAAQHLSELTMELKKQNIAIKTVVIL